VKAKPRKRVLAVAIGALVATSGYVIAEENEVLEEIVVKGIVKSIRDSQDLKRNANAVSEAISAQDIGKFPDVNVAEALQRVPGISITRERGEGKFISIRGLGPNFSPVTVNGRTITSGRAELAGSTSFANGSGREFAFSVLPSELVGGLVVHKSPTADLIEGGIGGVVEVKSRRPLDDPGRQMSISAQGVYEDQAKEIDPKVSGLYSDTFANDTVGVLLTGSFAQREVLQDRFWSWGWSRTGVDDINTANPNDFPNGLLPFEDVPSVVKNEFERIGFAGSVEYQPHDNLHMTVDGLYTETTSDSLENNMAIRWTNNNFVPFSITNPVLGAGDRLVSAESNPGGVEVTSRQENNIIVTETTAFGANLEWTGDSWTASGDIGYSKAESDWQTDSVRFFSEGHSLTYNLPDGQVIPDYVIGGDLTDPSLWQLRRIDIRDAQTEDEEFSAKLDVNFEINTGIVDTVQFGARYANRERNEVSAFCNTCLLSQSVGGGIPSDDPNVFGSPNAVLMSDLPQSDFIGGSFGLGSNVPREWATPDAKAINDMFARDIALTQEDGKTFGIDEKSYAVYAKADFSIDGNVPISGNVGVRVVRTDTASTGASFSAISIVQNVIQVANADFVTEKASYTEALPSFNLKADLREDLVARFAVAKSLTRPELTLIVPRFDFTNSNPPFGTGGNPNLDPFTAWNYDLSFEWYFADAGLASVGLFYKDVGGFVFNTRTINETVAGQVFATVDRPNNAAGADIYGVELNYQQVYDFLPGILSGLGTSINYTYIDNSTSFDDETAFPGQSFEFEGLSKHNANVVVFYEKGPISGRVAYNYRSKFLETTNFVFSSRSLDSYGQIDASISYDINDTYTVSLEGVNLTRNLEKNFDAGLPTAFSQVTRTGRKIFFGIRADF
jgi:iron complex outermembrane recepter protein